MDTDNSLPYGYSPNTSTPELKTPFYMPQIQKLNSDHREIIRLKKMGLNYDEIAKKVGCSKVKVNYTINGILGQMIIQDMENSEDVKVSHMVRRLDDIAVMAIEVLNTIVEDDDISMGLRFQAAKDILDRAGHSATKKLQVNSTHAHLTGDDIERIKDRARNAQIVDVVQEKEPEDGSSET